MNNVNKYEKYKSQTISVQTAGEHLILLFDEACISLNKAIFCIEAKDISGSHNSLMKAQSIYQYLIDSLDFNFTISNSLFSLYSFILDKLIEANMKKDPKLLKWVLDNTSQLRDTWKNADKLSRTQGAAG